VKCFTTAELMRWPGIEDIYGPHLRTTDVFQDKKRLEDLHTRVVEHVSVVCHHAQPDCN
jgi:26S proteasome regulatory subunit N5